MAYFLAEGSKFLFSETFGSAITVTAATNADPTVLSATSHGLVDNDEVLFTSGWEDATDAVWKADQLTADTLSLKGLDATDTQWYPAGAGTGTLRKVTNWLEIGQVLDVQPNGGDARNVTIEPLSRRNAINMPAGFNASSINLTLGYDPSTASQIALNKISRNLSKRIAFKFLLAGGQTGYGYGTAQLAQMPSIAKGSAISVGLTVNFLGLFVGYAS
ncbi:phage tail tube protein [Acidovorax sp. NB1]|uniref:phage tail tube protein n=1 Tax=Acidovorax sp. NB1 TaxID=1943571 RepID=UPI0010DAD027|nr:phage tail tube protein [Acidovorax sp. NB1]GDY37686.1 hypothetical protein ACINB_35780 [Acidovorax sp. NB1]